MTHSETNYISRKYTFIGIGVLLAGASLRIYNLSFQAIWLDEAFSAMLSQDEHFLALLIRDKNAALYHLLLKGWIKLLGSTPVSIRGLSVIIGLVTIATPMLWSKKTIPPKFLLCTSALIAFAPYHIYYSQEARGYILLILFLLISTLSFWQAFHDEQKGYWLLFSVSLLAALYTHFFTVLYIVPLFIAFVAMSIRRKTGMKEFAKKLPYFCGPFILLLPWLWICFAGQELYQQSWINQLWSELNPIKAIPYSLEILVLGPKSELTSLFLKQFTLFKSTILPRTAGIVAVLALIASLFLPYRHAKNEQKLFTYYLLWLTLAPLTCLLIISLWRPFYVIGRYDAVAFPAAIMLLALAIEEILSSKSTPRKLIGLALCMGFLLSTAYTLKYYYKADKVFHGFDSEVSANIIDKNALNGDEIIFTGSRGMATLYYLSQLDYLCQSGICKKKDKQLNYQIVPFDENSLAFDLDIQNRTEVTTNTLEKDILETLSHHPPRIWVLKARRKNRKGATIHNRINKDLQSQEYQLQNMPMEIRKYGASLYEKKNQSSQMLHVLM